MVERGEWGGKRRTDCSLVGAEARAEGGPGGIRRVQPDESNPPRRVSAPTAQHCTALNCTPLPAGACETEVVGARRGESARRVGGQLIVPLPPRPPAHLCCAINPTSASCWGEFQNFELDLLESAARLKLLGPIDLTIINLVIGTRSLQLTPLAKQHLLQLRMAPFFHPIRIFSQSCRPQPLHRSQRRSLHSPPRTPSPRSLRLALSTRTTSLKSLTNRVGMLPPTLLRKLPSLNLCPLAFAAYAFAANRLERCGDRSVTSHRWRIQRSGRRRRSHHGRRVHHHRRPPLARLLGRRYRRR